MTLGLGLENKANMRSIVRLSYTYELAPPQVGSLVPFWYICSQCSETMLLYR
jgi:hypothetical protein